MAFGLSSAGFSRKRLADIQTEIESALRQKMGNYINLLPSTVFANLIGVFADREATVWEMAEDVYNSQYPDTAEGVSLDNVAAISGLVRQPATYSRVLGVCLFGTTGTVVPAGTQLSVNGNPLAKFTTDVEKTLIAGTDEVQSLTFGTLPGSGTFKLKYIDEETSALAYNVSASALQNAMNALTKLSGVTVTGSVGAGFSITFSGNDGKQPHPLLTVTSNTTGSVATVVATTEGVSQAQVDVTATDLGPVQALYGTLTVIDTPVSGLDSCRNITDAVVGRNQETDLEFRARRAETLQVAGAATPDAIRSRLLNITGVTDALVFENTSQVTLDGRPPKSYEVVVAGGDEQDILDSVWASKPAGIETVGTVVGSVTDSQGVVQTVKFSRPTDVPIYITMSLVTDTTFPATGLTLVQTALINFINNLGIGTDVVVFPQLIVAMGGIPGILDITVAIGKLPSPTLNDNITIAANEIPVTDVTKVLVS